jgi:hypothetical protein
VIAVGAVIREHGIGGWKASRRACYAGAFFFGYPLPIVVKIAIISTDWIQEEGIH